ncbi:DUF3718 domain-containing protein [Thalassotalea atypica]|uniref:DUF3718 domain-containing protein n=1 Tax=Thalassotalea atypica TaxID=2054316 RepID=UPI00257376F4|nr:DUF3718 domain-containing protein [Thalassotalea atypica]
MKLLLIVVSMFILTLTVSSPAVANDSIAMRICEYVAANDKNRLRSFLKQNKLKIRGIFNDVNCNGDNLLIFAGKNKALEVGEFIIGKTPSKTVAANIAELEKYSAHLAEDAKDRVN